MAVALRADRSSPYSDAASYSDTSVISITTYYYCVKARNTVDSSGYSNTASVPTPADIPRVPKQPIGLLRSKPAKPEQRSDLDGQLQHS